LTMLAGLVAEVLNLARRAAMAEVELVGRGR
jgi:hypothetical protein